MQSITTTINGSIPLAFRLVMGLEEVSMDFKCSYFTTLVYGDSCDMKLLHSHSLGINDATHRHSNFFLKGGHLKKTRIIKRGWQFGGGFI